MGDQVRKLPGRPWKLPRHEDDEAAEEGIGRILALSDPAIASAVAAWVAEQAARVLATGDPRTSG